jgi:hypothetical protein
MSIQRRSLKVIRRRRRRRQKLRNLQLLRAIEKLIEEMKTDPIFLETSRFIMPEDEGVIDEILLTPPNSPQSPPNTTPLRAVRVKPRRLFT